MPRKHQGRTYHNFAPVYRMALEAFRNPQVRRYTLECDSEREAKKTRFDVYNFLTALRKQHTIFELKEERNTYEAMYVHDLCELSYAISVVVAGSRVLFERRPFYQPMLLPDRDAQSLQEEMTAKEKQPRIKSYKDLVDPTDEPKQE